MSCNHNNNSNSNNNNNKKHKQVRYSNWNILVAARHQREAKQDPEDLETNVRVGHVVAILHHHFGECLNFFQASKSRKSELKWVFRGKKNSQSKQMISKRHPERECVHGNFFRDPFWLPCFLHEIARPNKGLLRGHGGLHYPLIRPYIMGSSSEVAKITKWKRRHFLLNGGYPPKKNEQPKHLKNGGWEATLSFWDGNFWGANC